MLKPNSLIDALGWKKFDQEQYVWSSGRAWRNSDDVGRQCQLMNSDKNLSNSILRALWLDCLVKKLVMLRCKKGEEMALLFLWQVVASRLQIYWAQALFDGRHAISWPWGAWKTIIWKRNFSRASRGIGGVSQDFITCYS